MTMQRGQWISHVLNKLMSNDPNFLKYDIEFLFADQYISTDLIRFGTRTWALKKLKINIEEVYNYQNHIIDLFDNVPWFMPSQIRNASFHSNYDVLRIEEKAFGIPD